MHATARDAQASLGQTLTSDAPSLNHTNGKKIVKKCSQAHSRGLFPQSMSLSPVDTSAVFTIPTILAAKLGAAVLLSGVLSWCPDVLKFSKNLNCNEITYSVGTKNLTQKGPQTHLRSIKNFLFGHRLWIRPLLELEKMAVSGRVTVLEYS